MSDIFQEVDEEFQKDRFSELWDRFGWIVWLAGIAIVVAVGANEFMQYRAGEAREARALKLEAALASLEAGDYDASIEGLSALVDAGSDLSSVAGHYLAEARLEGQGDRAGAIAALEEAANGDGPFAELALLKAAYLKSETATMAELETLIAPLLESDASMAALAQELIAAKAFQEEDFERARSDFNFLRFAPNAPPGLSQRADIALAAIPRSPSEDAEPAADAGDGALPGGTVREGNGAEGGDTPSAEESPVPDAGDSDDGKDGE